ncbi:MAG: hypothetical protein Q9186_002923 [Xanthomendoza sp. 1 TL-2023]
MPATLLPTEHGGNLPEEDLGDFVLVDDLFKARAKDKLQRPLLAFPKSERGVSDFETFTGRDLDRFIEHVARYYMHADLKVNHLARVALLGPTNIEWIATFYGLLRAGFAVLTLSPRLSAKAIVNLMSETQCESIIHPDAPQLLRVVDQAKSLAAIQTISMMSRTAFDRPLTDEPPLARDIDKNKEAERLVVILHSSGSTGLPKPIYTNHNRYVQPMNPVSPGTRDFVTLPMYHAFPMSIVPWKMYSRRTIYFLNPNLPLTGDNVTEAITAAQPDAFYAVPYIFKLLAEQPRSVELLRSCYEAVTVGSGSMDRDAGDKEWAYLRIPSSKMKNIWPRPIGNEQYEFVFLEGYSLAVESNSIDPPNAFHSKDVFSPHPTISNAWKYLGRLDDRVTLLNGEKVLPLPIEGRVKKHPLVKEDVVFGVSRPLPGLLVFRADAAKDLTDDEFVDEIWADVEAANETAEGFSQISKDMMVPLPAGIEYPQADKGSMIRPQMYRTFEKEIDDAYGRLEHVQEGTLQLEVSDLEEHLLNIGIQLVGEQLKTKTTDFFTAGMDSLRAIQMRGLIVKDLDLGGNSKDLSQNIVFETANVENLAKHLYEVRQGHASETKDWKIVMKGLKEKYSVFQTHKSSSEHVVVLTGATGGLGSHIVSQLSRESSVSRVYCLLRGSDPLQRLRNSLEERKLDLQDSKVTALTSDLSQPYLGLEEADYSEIQSSATHIIHAAWPVNFQLALPSFEPHIQGLHNLLQLSLSSPNPTPSKVLFCSSVSTALGAPAPIRIPETTLEDLDYASDMGYGQSKFVGEHIIAAAVNTAGAQASVLRIGQVVGDTKFGMWNDQEAFPSIVRSALTMGILPELAIECEWLPVDVLAESVIELAGIKIYESDATTTTTAVPTKADNDDANLQPNGTVSDDKSLNTDLFKDSNQQNLVYNLLSPHTFSWTHSFLPALRVAGLSFTAVPTEVWLERLRSLSSQQSSSSFSSSSDPPTSPQDTSPCHRNDNPAATDPEKNPALKLLQYFESAYGGKNGEDGRVDFEIRDALRDSKALREVEDVVGSGLVQKMVGWWMGRWGESDEGCVRVMEEQEDVRNGDGEKGEAGEVDDGRRGDGVDQDQGRFGETVTANKEVQMSNGVGEKEHDDNDHAEKEQCHPEKEEEKVKADKVEELGEQQQGRSGKEALVD